MGKPNILHIFTDMQRADTIAALGNPVIRTPNLDRLCREGVAFTNAFSPSPVCISARCSMIHGQYPHNTGCYENTVMPTDGRETFMDALSAAGYRTHGIGKCHFTPDRYALRGFGSREIQEEGGSSPEELPRNHYLSYLNGREHDHICEAFGVRGEMYYIPQPSQVPERDHPTRWIGDRSVDFIRERKGDRDPWYLFSSFIHPHPPFTPPNPWHKLYRPAMMPLPNTPPGFETLHTFINKVQNRYKYRDQGTDRNLVRLIKAYYYACVSFIDAQVGRLIEALEDNGQLDNTLIVFTSDHGELLGDYGCWGKRSMHDASARVPLIARMPGRFDGGRVCGTPVSLVDLAPTFLSAAGGSIGTHELDGKDLCDIAAGRSERKYVFSRLSCAGSMTRRYQGDRYVEGPSAGSRDDIAAYSSYLCVSREWKYVYSAPDGREFFFDRTGDPLETRNRKGVEFCAGALREHREALIGHLTAGGETAGINGTEWKRFPVREIDPDPDTGLLIQDLYTPWAEIEIPGYEG